MKKLVLLLLLFPLIKSAAFAQDTLPKFSVKNVGSNRIIIGWINSFPNIRQISIQRSFDSLSNYKTILTVADPTTPQNGYVDGKATNDHMFYRLYILLDKGVYLFSDAKRPSLDSIRRADFPTRNGFPPIDSVRSPLVNGERPRSNTFMPSLYIYTNRDGYVRVTLPEAEKSKKYSIKFFDDDDIFLFELKEVKERDFKIDKANFYHAGWFRFELFEDGKLLEKHKFFLEKEF